MKRLTILFMILAFGCGCATQSERNTSPDLTSRADPRPPYHEWGDGHNQLKVVSLRPPHRLPISRAKATRLTGTPEGTAHGAQLKRTYFHYAAVSASTLFVVSNPGSSQVPASLKGDPEWIAVYSVNGGRVAFNGMCNDTTPAVSEKRSMEPDYAAVIVDPDSGEVSYWAQDDGFQGC